MPKVGVLCAKAELKADGWRGEDSL